MTSSEHPGAPARDRAELAGPAAWRADAVAGFLVFLVALPLSLGISVASGFPPFAGVTTAVVGGFVATFLGSAPLTIKGPAAGLIVVVLAAVEELGGGDPLRGYSRTLAVVVVSGGLIALLGVAKAGRLGELVPRSAVHGMLAAIGVVIVSKQAHAVLGVTPTAKGPLGLLAELPRSLATANPVITAIGVLGLVVLFAWPRLGAVRGLGKVPAPLVVLLVTMPIGALLGLGEAHVLTWGDATFRVGPEHLVRVPARLSAVLAFPDFAPLGEPVFWKHLALFTLVAGLESVLSAKAIETLDPWRRRVSLDRDLVAQGAANVVAGMFGGLPMISEIVRSSANVDGGGRTSRANFFHGLFLLVFVALAPALVHRIPLAALAAMLVYTGCRLAHPRELVRAWKAGPEGFAGFATTVFVTLAVDLLAGIAAGALVEIGSGFARGRAARWRARAGTAQR